MFELPEIEWFAQPLRGEVESSITGYQVGRVSFRGTSWFARLDDPSYHSALKAGDPVMVLGREGCTTLVVMPFGIVSRQPKRDRVQATPEEKRNSWWQWLAS